MRIRRVLLLAGVMLAIGSTLGLGSALASEPDTVSLPGLAREVDTDGVPPPSPTPTPSPTPNPEPTADVAPATIPPSWPRDRALTSAEMDSLLQASNFPAWTHATVKRVAWCESSWKPWRTGLVGERGLMQLRPEYHQWRANLFGGDLYDPLTNMQAAHHLWKEQGWRPWTCGP